MTPELNGQKIIDCLGLDEMENCYEMYEPIKEVDCPGLEALAKTISDFRKKRMPYCVTVDTSKIPSELHFWVEGVEKRAKNSDDYKSTRLNGVER